MATLDDIAARLPDPADGGAVVVFDADGTLWDGDIQEALLQDLVASRSLRAVDYEGDVYHDEYESLLDENPARAMARAVTLLDGLALVDVQAVVRRLWDETFCAAVYEPVRGFVDISSARGYTPWVVTASAEEVVRVLAPAVGFTPECVAGVRVQMGGGRFSDRLDGPVTFGSGKVEAIDARIGRRPAVVVGNGPSDADMLAVSERLSIVVNPGAELRTLAAERGWEVLDVAA